MDNQARRDIGRQDASGFFGIRAVGIGHRLCQGAEVHLPEAGAWRRAFDLGDAERAENVSSSPSASLIAPSTAVLYSATERACSRAPSNRW